MGISSSKSGSIAKCLTYNGSALGQHYLVLVEQRIGEAGTLA